MYKISGSPFRLRQQNHADTADHRTHCGLPGLSGNAFAIEIIRIFTEPAVKFLPWPDMIREVMHERDDIRGRNMIDQCLSVFADQMINKKKDLF